MWKRKLSREQWVTTLCKTAPAGCEVGIEACASSHHWARQLTKHGYQVKLIPAQFVTPYVKSNKNDSNDAEAICEAMSRPNMRYVKMKSVEQQDIQATHRVRSELMGHRTAKVNQIRGLVAEYGLVAPRQVSSLRSALPRWLEDADNGLTDRFRALLKGLWDDLIHMDSRIPAPYPTPFGGRSARGRERSPGRCRSNPCYRPRRMDGAQTGGGGRGHPQETRYGPRSIDDTDTIDPVRTRPSHGFEVTSPSSCYSNPMTTD